MLFDDNGATPDGIKRSVSLIFAPTGQHPNNLDQPSRDRSIRRLTTTVRKEMFSSDIVSSTRLFGYVFCAICSGLLFLSALLFKYHDKPNSNYVVPWKLNGAIVFGAVGCGIMLFIVSCHVWFLPHYWLQVYRDGSKKERNIIISFFAYWSIVLWTCTGVFSVGSSQTNVFVSTWLAFFALLNIYNDWRIAAVSDAYIRIRGFWFTYFLTACLFRSGSFFVSKMVERWLPSLPAHSGLHDVFFSPRACLGARHLHKHSYISR